MSLFPARPLWPIASTRIASGMRRPRPPVQPAAEDRVGLGMAAILASTIAFPLSDLTAQALLRTLPPLEVAWLRYVVFALSVLPLLGRGGATLRPARPGLQLLRGTAAAVSTLSAIVSFHFLAVPTATAIGFAAPVLVTGLAALVLKEAVGLRRWAAALVALAGVLIIVQPGGESFRPASMIPLIGAGAVAVAAICTRLNAADGPVTTVIVSALVGLALLSVLVMFDWRTPTATELGLALVVGLFGALGSLLQAYAYRVAPASMLAPLTYTQLIWASGLSFLLLGTVPSAAMAAGAALIACSATYTAWRERVRGLA